MTTPCRRSTGTERRWFDTVEDALAFKADPLNVDYHEDEVTLCGRCGKFHLSHPSWLEFKPWEKLAAKLVVN